VRGVQQVGEQKPDKLERHADQRVPGEGEDGADGEAVDVDFRGGGGTEAAGEGYGGFPVGRGSVGGGCFVGL
jgi:hypothetical protein